MASLGDKVRNTLVDWLSAAFVPITDALEHGLKWGVEWIGDAVEDTLRPFTQPMVDKIKASPHISQETKDMLDATQGRKGAWFTIPLIVIVGILMIIPMIPGLRSMFSGTDKLAEYESNRAQTVGRYMPVEAIAAVFRDPGLRSVAESDLRDLGYDTQRIAAYYKIFRYLLSDDDIRELFLRGEITSQEAIDKLKARGYSEGDIAELQKLYWRIPAPPDLIRMAVREVFTPEIVDKFGQMEDFPEDFGIWAEKQGLSTEWAKNYWAAHWDLPSATQGFDMFHRGIIDRPTLEMLLRALDVMPFWRDKLIGIAYRIPTRVDIRRMYKLGVYTREDVKATYIKAGYSPEDSEDITEFVIRYYGDDEETDLDRDLDYTKSEILDGYRKRLITEDEARELLRALDWQDNQINFYLDREDLKKDQSLKDAYLSRYRTLFIEGIMPADRVQEELEVVGISRPEFEAVLPLWQLEKITRVQRPTRAQFDGFLQDGIITWATWEAEYQLDGYSAEYISWFRAALEAKIGEAT